MQRRASYLTQIMDSSHTEVKLGARGGWTYALVDPKGLSYLGVHYLKAGRQGKCVFKWHPNKKPKESQLGFFSTFWMCELVTLSLKLKLMCLNLCQSSFFQLLLKAHDCR